MARGDTRARGTGRDQMAQPDALGSLLPAAISLGSWGFKECTKLGEISWFLASRKLTHFFRPLIGLAVQDGSKAVAYLSLLFSVKEKGTT